MSQTHRVLLPSTLLVALLLAVAPGCQGRLQEMRDTRTELTRLDNRLIELQDYLDRRYAHTRDVKVSANPHEYRKKLLALKEEVNWLRGRVLEASQSARPTPARAEELRQLETRLAREVAELHSS